MSGEGTTDQDTTVTCFETVERRGLELAASIADSTPVREQNPQIGVTPLHQLYSVEVVEAVSTVAQVGLVENRLRVEKVGFPFHIIIFIEIRCEIRIKVKLQAKQPYCGSRNIVGAILTIIQTTTSFERPMG